jgi:hypothetical protein
LAASNPAGELYQVHSSIRRMNNFHSFAGIAAGLLAGGCMVPYIYSTLKRQTKPHRVTWWVICTLDILMTVNQVLTDGGATIWLPLFAAIGHGALAILSIWHGEGRWSKFDVMLIAGALFSVVIWQKFNSPVFALGWNVIIDFLGFFPTLQKAYRAPKTESFSSWVLSFAGASLNMLAVEQWSGYAIVLPCYGFAVNALILTILVISPSGKNQVAAAID